jgi:hypothetical protein
MPLERRVPYLSLTCQSAIFHINEKLRFEPLRFGLPDLLGQAARRRRCSTGTSSCDQGGRGRDVGENADFRQMNAILLTENAETKKERDALRVKHDELTSALVDEKTRYAAASRSERHLSANLADARALLHIPPRRLRVRACSRSSRLCELVRGRLQSDCSARSAASPSAANACIKSIIWTSETVQVTRSWRPYG